jgi:hypothetical protein
VAAVEENGSQVDDLFVCRSWKASLGAMGIAGACLKEALGLLRTIDRDSMQTMRLDGWLLTRIRMRRKTNGCSEKRIRRWGHVRIIKMGLSGRRRLKGRSAEREGGLHVHRSGVMDQTAKRNTNTNTQLRGTP